MPIYPSVINKYFVNYAYSIVRNDRDKDKSILLRYEEYENDCCLTLIDTITNKRNRNYTIQRVSILTDIFPFH